MIDQVRRFNRTVTQRIGALDDTFLARGRPLGQARLLWEIGPDGRDVRDLRARLDLDSGYLSRLLRSLENDGLITVEASEADGRIRTARLTAAGQAERAELDRLSDDAAASLLGPLTTRQRGRLVTAMAEVERLLAASAIGVSVRDPRHPDARRCLRAYVEELSGRFDGGFDPARSISAADREMTPPAGLFLVATQHGEPVGCGALKFHPGAPAEVKRMWVAPSVRGLGLGRRLLAELETRAAAHGVRVLRLETNRALGEAIGLYRSAGYHEVAAFNDEPYAHHWFEKALGALGKTGRLPKTLERVDSRPSLTVLAPGLRPGPPARILERPEPRIAGGSAQIPLGGRYGGGRGLVGSGGVLSEAFPWQLAELRPGSALAGYTLEAQVGAGGMAVVFRARDERLGRLVALKVLASTLTADDGFRRRFIAESRAAAAVDDPHIIPVYEAGEANGALFIAMRFVRGGDLRGVLGREGRLAPARAAGFISPVASALDTAHGAGLVHRDVKPANILVDARPGRPEHVYLSDFGVSKGAMSSVSLTAAGQFLGTPDYSAPEQIQGLAVDGRADQYALACVTYQLLAGAVPFERDQGMAVLFAHLSAPPPSLAARRPDLPRAVDQVLARALAKAPEKRFESCRDYAEALREALGLPRYLRAETVTASGPPQPPAASPPAWFAGSAAPTIDSGLAPPADPGLMPPAAAIGTAATRPGREAARTMPQVTRDAPQVTRAAAAERQSPGVPGAPGVPARAARSGPPRRRRTRRAGAILAAGAVLAAAGLAIGTQLGTAPHPGAGATPGGPARATPPGSIPRGPTAYVLAGNGIVPVNLTTDTPGQTIAIAGTPGGIAVTRDAGMAYVTDGDSIIPVNLATGQPGPPVSVGHPLAGIVVTPDGKIAYVVDPSGAGSVIRVDLTTGMSSQPVNVDHPRSLPGGGTAGDEPISITITPDGKTVYTASYEAWTVTPVDVATGTPGTPVKVGQNPNSIAIAPDGKTAYTADAGDGTVTPVDLATGTARAPVHVPGAPWAIAITPDGKTAYVATEDGHLFPVNLATGTLGQPVAIGSHPQIAITPDGKVAYLIGGPGSAITPVRLATGTLEPPIRLRQAPDEIVIAN